jgi:hypothetical protein
MRIKNITLFIIIFITINACQTNTVTQTEPVEFTVENVLDTIWSLNEVNDRNDLVKNKTKNKRSLMVYINGTPDENKADYFWVKVAEDNGVAYFTHFDFYVYPNWDIKYYDRIRDQELTLDEWRQKNKLK